MFAQVTRTAAVLSAAAEHFRPRPGPSGSLINLLISDKAQMMPRGVPFTNTYNMSTNNCTPKIYITNTVRELNNRFTIIASEQRKKGIKLLLKISSFHNSIEEVLVYNKSSNLQDFSKRSLCSDIFDKGV